MHPDIRKLLEVQKVDQTLARIRRDLESLPAEEARRQHKLEQVRKQAEQAKTNLQEAEVQSRAQEKSIVAADEELKKLTSRLNTVKNNAEYQATLFQIESVKRERSSIEDEGMQLLEQVDGLRDAATKAEATLAEEEETFAVFRKEAAELRAARERDLAAAGEGRESTLGDVPPDLMQKYSALFETRDAQAVCAVEGQVCTGCYTQVTPNDIARLAGKGSIVQCGSCQRLLYLSE
ncbi:MAG: C4-type zinc ribbon domain-containing protein [Planctomycetota bacterium]